LKNSISILKKIINNSKTSKTYCNSFNFNGRTVLRDVHVFPEGPMKKWNRRSTSWFSRFFGFSIFDHFDSAPTHTDEYAQPTTGTWALVVSSMLYRTRQIESLLVSEKEVDFSKMLCACGRFGRSVFPQIFSSSKISCIFVFRWLYEMLNSSFIVDLFRCADEIKLWLVLMILCRRRKVFRERLISGCMVMETRTWTSKKCALDPFLCMLSQHKAWLLQQLQQTNPVAQHGRERVLEMRDLYIREILVVPSQHSLYSYLNTQNQTINMFFEISTRLWAHIQDDGYQKII